MVEWVFGPLENFSKFDKLYDEPGLHIHREDCPMGYKANTLYQKSTCCLCKQLDKADREAEKEDRADDDRKYGGM